MLVPLLLDLSGVVSAPVNATASAALPVIMVFPMRPLWVSENPTDTIVVTPNPTPVGSFQ
jgi:hypothetical protein